MDLFGKIERGEPYDASQFVICCGCESALVKSARMGVCPLCHSYQFETEEKEVRRGIQTLYERRKKGESRIPDFEDD
jgi:hypothetical protein